MRVYALYLVVAVLAVYAWRDWFKSLCGLILLVAVIGHGDMPTNVAGIQGLNPWNTLLFFVFVAWLATRRREGPVWDMPAGMMWALIAYVLVILVSYVRAAMDLGSFPAEQRLSLLGLTSEYLINPLKYMVPGLLLYDGCRTRRRLVLALTCVLLVGVGYALLAARTVPLSALVSEQNFMQHRRYLGESTGLHANYLGPMLVGMFWAIIGSFHLWRRWALRMAAASGAAVVFLGMALCHSRAAYFTAAAVGLLLGVLRWRVLLVILPALGLVVVAVMPSVSARLAMGFGEVDPGGGTAANWDEVTAGRTTGLWPPVLAQIPRSPLIGFGRLAIWRTQVYGEILAGEGTCPSHPHNAYLEMALDAGGIGLMVALAFYGGLLLFAMRLFRDRRDPLATAVGAAGVASIGSLLVAGMSGQTLFPEVFTIPALCLGGMVLRMSVALRHRGIVQAMPFRPSGMIASRPLTSAPESRK
ncbi:MAG: O-antigen ligase family protein [Planctomycetota bacterium]|nr:O-antigen ligase family protein [Planctomycetota bacterium]